MEHCEAECPDLQFQRTASNAKSYLLSRMFNCLQQADSVLEHIGNCQELRNRIFSALMEYDRFTEQLKNGVVEKEFSGF